MNDAYFKATHPAMALMLLCLAVAAPCAARSADLKLYVLDCGHATFKDMGGFSDTGEYDGKSGEIAVPCFLIRHPEAIFCGIRGWAIITTIPRRAAMRRRACTSGYRLPFWRNCNRSS